MASEIENNEWLNDYTALKQVNKNNPFTVPNGYFDELDAHIITAIKLDELKNSIAPGCFAVPQNYFNELNSNIQSRIAVDELLNKEHTGLTVPENYFNELNSNIQSRIAFDELLNKEHTGLTVPENYFDALNSNIQSRIAVDELLNKEHTGLTVPENYFAELSSSIQSRLLVEEALVNAEDTFTVPPDYFNRLNKELLAKTVNQPVKRKSAVIRMISSTVFKYATAACVILMLGTGAFLRFEATTVVPDGPSFLHKELATIPVDAIQSYLDENVDANDMQHTVAAENLPVNDAGLKAALQDYTDDQ